MQNTNTITIGRLAKAAGVNIETIRHYQNKGLIIEPEKPAKGFRQYPISTLERLKFIKTAQKLGFSLREIKEILDLGENRCTEVEQLANQKLLDLRNRVTELESIIVTIDQLLNCCHTQNKAEPCSFVKGISENRTSC